MPRATDNQSHRKQICLPVSDDPFDVLFNQKWIHIDYGPALFIHPFILEGADKRYFEFRAPLFKTCGHFTFACTTDDLEQGDIKPVCHDDDWAEALMIPGEHYRGLRIGEISPALDTLLTKIGDRQVEDNGSFEVADTPGE